MSDTFFCERCQSEQVRGRQHACIKATPNTQKKPTPNVKPVDKSTPNTTPNADILDAPTPNFITGIKGRSARDKRYRDVHREQRSNYMRDYMRKRRAK